MNLNNLLNKTTLTVAAIIIVAGLVYMNFNTRAKLISSREQIEVLSILNGSIARENARLDSMRTFYMNGITLRDTILAHKQKELQNKDKEISTLKTKLVNSLADVKKLTADSSYKHLQVRMITTGLDSMMYEKEDLKFKYPFTGVQVKTIHYTFTERDGLSIMNDSLSSYVINLKVTSSLKDDQMKDLRSLNGVYQDKLTLCETQGDAYIAEVKDLKKDVKKQKNLKTASNIGALGLIALIIALIL